MTQPGYEGWGALGDVLGGGVDQRLAVKHQSNLGIAADTARKWNDASKARSEAIIQQSMLEHRQTGDAAIDGVYGANSPQAAFAKFVLGSAATPNAGNLGKFQTPGYAALVQEQQDALAKGDFKRMNATTAVLGSKPYEPVRAVDGNLIDSGVPLGPDLHVQPLPQTQAGIDQKHAILGQGQQRTDAYVAHEARAPAHHGSKIAQRAATMDDDIALLEHEMGRKVTPQERADYLQGKPIKGDPVITHSTLGGGAAKPHSGAFRMHTINGVPTVDVNSPDEAKAAWPHVQHGHALRFPNGTIKIKD